ncbi:hypothetical protein OG322_04450 [Streptomyces sp. NBC_01260]|uniref:hypothetical protein n=1 Tax=unclassified Streptomyces TaxID=2593676 RepID=UPI000F46A948|nr:MULTISPECIES: hypothetical protein [unclassified Streptomyces]ROQ77197.1 hypothetical protein EDD95_3705 [Streptomyces sp. CEV 2-1]
MTASRATVGVRGGIGAPKAAPQRVGFASETQSRFVVNGLKWLGGGGGPAPGSPVVTTSVDARPAAQCHWLIAQG